MNTPQGRKQGVETMRKKYGKNVYAKLGSKGGALSSNRPFKDPAAASRAAKIGWEKRRARAKAAEEQQSNVK